ncbi:MULTISPECIES: [FeFe] hydrogenase H-cluster radical SAM maturase HydG [unclassified Fusibacter]|uniref:[FeFe] hydrogenase H-cluster radical SAM maturase HydG n=1 Tax=unclassified Fusibacter TaxID=2624464 RepID=UPI0010139F2A|nr:MULTISPECIES: [FeFe] hydrogenase H-cluster radical SAM maturase HydG [unclassified Fusibacter]MCK8060974.1 [FeFe] hydrogenase H-cluster radical SAM maturase HydG [Fusibacter sp. A2]NPE20572.1 [FeFe] hydrogenase H-cluster radical SAM maturase HydG [Fusibacter sp. A1]RXV63769.1 [FeFe] hydrogenase H-cluster radical SAM maturase HydG [Fusibacter sp. A1]
MFINHEYISNLLNQTKNAPLSEIDEILTRAEAFKGLSHEDVAKLLTLTDSERLTRMYNIAGKVKKSIYGDRVVMFAPLYISDYCVNNCTYCGYQRDNKFARRKLTQEEIRKEVILLEKMGHKRLALEVGEDPVNADIDYVVESIKTIYDTYESNGDIRRINVNIAATSVEEYKKLKAAEIGTYILFQETYHRPTYEIKHPKSLKGDYERQLYAFDRAMQAGIDDVGAGVLFGLYDYQFEVLALMLHNEELEKQHGVGFHTISVPRLKAADGLSFDDYPHLVSDDEFRKLVAIIRLAVPFVGMILSTRESAEFRKELLGYGISQVSAGSCTGVGGYKEREEGINHEQFHTADDRSPMEVVSGLIEDGYIPSYCTACYRSGRTGDRFMQLAKSGSIGFVCEPNALMTLMEYIHDYGDDALREKTLPMIYEKANAIPRADVKELLLTNLEKIAAGERDLFL